MATSKSVVQIEVESFFPTLKRRPYVITSSKTPIYNCIAWVAGDISKWWEFAAITSLGLPTHWPNGYRPGETVEDVSALFEGLFLFTPTSDRRVRSGFEKIAIYGLKDLTFGHIARQLTSGRWSSKLGELCDLEHALSDLEGKIYGRVQKILERPIPDSR